MSLLSEVQAFVEHSHATTTLADLSQLMEGITGLLGFDYFALVQHVDVRKSNNQDQVWLSSYPKSWVETFEVKGLYAVDPIHVASQYTNAGFVWSDVGNLIRLSASQKRVLTDAAREGLGDGFKIPAHIPGESNGTCSFAMRAGRSLPKSTLMAAQLIGTYAMEAGRKIVRETTSGPQSKPKLTQRQLECVLLVARGKTDWEISKILGIKEHTVRDYVDEACQRYEVHRRTQVVIRALHDGHLTLRDAIG